MKKLMSLTIVFLMLFSSLFALTVSADEQLMYLDATDIEAVVNADGTVNVTEVWHVTATAQDRGFDRKIDLYDSKGENEMQLIDKIDEIKDVTVQIDGVSAREAASGVNTFTAGQSSDGKSFDIHISSPTVNTEKVYTIAYTLVGAVKKDGGSAVFSYRVIGKTFLQTSNNITVNVILPDGIDMNDLVTDGAVHDKTVSFDSRRVSDMFHVSVKMDASVFDDGALASYSSFTESLKGFGSKIKSAIPVILFILVSVIVVLIVLLPDKLRRAKTERRVSKIMIKDSLSNIEALPAGLTPCEAYKMLEPYSRAFPKKTAKNVPLLFALAVLECIEKGYIAVSDTDLIVGTPSGEVPDYILSVLNFIKSLCAKKDGKYVIDSAFVSAVQNECASHYDMIAGYLASFYALVPAVDDKFFKSADNRAFYEKAYAVKLSAEKSKSKLTLEDCISCVLAGESVGHMHIFAMMFSSLSNEKLLAAKNESAVGAIAVAVNAMYNVYVKSK